MCATTLLTPTALDPAQLNAYHKENPTTVCITLEVLLVCFSLLTMQLSVEVHFYIFNNHLNMNNNRNNTINNNNDNKNGKSNNSNNDNTKTIRENFNLGSDSDTKRRFGDGEHVWCA